MFVGKYFAANGDRYEGDHKDGKFHAGTGTTPYTPHIPPSPLPPSQSNKMFLLLLCVWGFLSLFCIRKETIY